jgi:uncharacterized membrane protein
MPFKLGPLELLLMIPVLLVGLAVYLLPTIIAAFRRHPNALAIFLIDFLFGWTFIGWVGALIWSLITPTAALSGNLSPLEIARERYARGEISQAQFEEIKKNLA